MKKYIVSLVMLLWLQTAMAQAGDSVYLFSYFKNNGQDGLHLAYSRDGYQWTALNHDSAVLAPIVAKDRLMRDPCIARGGDNKFHMVWTVSWNDRGIGYASSPDLIHWSTQQFLPVMQEEPLARNCWAPEIFYDAAQAQYMIYWATTIPGRFMAGDTSGDDRYNHRLYYTTTRDFITFSKTKLLYDGGFNVIDATILQAGKQYMMFIKDETRRPPQKNIRVVSSSRPDGGYGKPSPPLTGAYWAEGPSAIRIKDHWMLYFDKYMESSYGALASADMKQWTDISGSIRFPRGARHGTVFALTQKEFDRLYAVMGEK